MKKKLSIMAFCAIEVFYSSGVLADNGVDRETVVTEKSYFLDDNGSPTKSYIISGNKVRVLSVDRSSNTADIEFFPESVLATIEAHTLRTASFYDNVVFSPAVNKNVTASRAYFYSAPDSSKYAGNVYIIKGDMVTVSKRINDFYLVSYTNPKTKAVFNNVWVKMGAFDPKG